MQLNIIKLFKNLFIFILLISSVSVQAQKSFQPGTITTLNGELIDGYILFKEWVSSPNIVTFKKSIDSTPEQFGIHDIAAFEVSNIKYTSAIIDVETSSARADGLTYYKKFYIDRDTAFLKSLIIGDKSLYVYQNGGKNQFYIEKNDDFELLKYKRYLRSIGEKEVVAERKDFISQLAEYLDDCESISSELSNLRYNINDLKKLFRAYYECAATSEPEYVFKKGKIATSAGLFMGAGYSQLDIVVHQISSINRVTKVLVGMDREPAISRVFGAHYEFNFPGLKRKRSFLTELTSVRYMFNFQQEQGLPRSRVRLNIAEYGFVYMKLNTLLKYYLRRTDNSEFFLTAGFSNGWIIKELANDLIREDYDEDGFLENTSVYTINTRLTKHERGAIIGIGYKIKLLNLQLRYERASGTSRWFEWSSPIYSYWLMAGINIPTKKK